MCDNMIVGAACMAHSAVEGGQARLMYDLKEGGSIFFFILFTIFFTIFFFRGDNTQAALSQDVVATFLLFSSFYTLS